MSMSGTQAVFDTPSYYDISIGTGSASGVIHVGDWLVYSGQGVVPTYAGGLAYWKASAAGVALESNPQYDWAGRSMSATAIRFVREGVIRASAAFSGVVPLGVGAYPVATGSGVSSPTGLTGLGATWQTGVKLPVSGGTGAGGSGVGIVIGNDQTRAVAGTGQIDILLLAPRPDFY